MFMGIAHALLIERNLQFMEKFDGRQRESIQSHVLLSEKAASQKRLSTWKLADSLRSMWMNACRQSSCDA